MPEAPSTPVLERWCHGGRFAGTRRLTDAEREAIARRRNGHRQRALLGAAVFPASVVLLLAAGAVLKPSGDLATVVMGGGAFFAWCLGLPVSILLFRDHFALATRLSKDLATSEVWVFTPPGDDVRDEDAVGSAAPPSRSVELLPHARQLLWSGEEAPRLGTEFVREAAPDPGIRLRAPLALDMTPAAPGVRLLQRALGAAERGEIERAARRLLVPGLGALIAAPAFVYLLVLAATVPLAEAGAIGLLNLALALTICGFTLARYGRGLVLSRRLRVDLELGLVVHAEAGADERDTEFLPASRLLWRVGGVPAEWRDHTRGAGLLRASL